MAEKRTEYRSHHGGIEIRQAGNEGIFDGYACKWNQLDDYNSIFERGAFTKTLAERGSKIKILYNHKNPIGKPLELREDDQGLFVRGKLSLGVEEADTAYQLMQDGVIDTLSFGFNVPQGGDYYKGGVRHITEVKLYEVSPVTFAANENARITAVRSTDFAETLNEDTMSQQGYMLFEALWRTIDDIWFSDSTNDELMSNANAAIDDFKVAFMRYAQNYVDTFRANDQMRSIFGGESAIALRKHLDESGQTIETMAQESVFSAKELSGLLIGKRSIPKQKQASLPESIRAAYLRDCSKDVEALCDHVRDNGMTGAERARLTSLLGIESRAADEVQSVISNLSAWRNRLTT